MLVPDRPTSADPLFLSASHLLCCSFTRAGLKTYYQGKLDELELVLQDKQQNLRRLEAQRNDLNLKGNHPLSLSL